MRKFYVTIGILLVFLATSLPIPISAYAQQEAPSYAQWGKVAIKEVQTKYPQAKILDYLHEGSEIFEDSTIEKFKLWLKQSDKEFGVYVKIKYITETNKVVNVELQETS